MTDKIKKHFLLLRQRHPDTTDEALAVSAARYAGWAKIVEEYYHEIAGHVWDVRAYGAAMRGEENTHPPLYARNDMHRWVEEHGDEMPEGFEPNYFHVIGGSSGGYCGQGGLPSAYSVTYLNSACGVKTAIHEIGHNLGLHHAATQRDDYLDDDGNVVEGLYKEYGDTTSVMGLGTNVRPLTAPHLHILGAETDRETKLITETQQVLLGPLHQPARDLRENEIQTARIYKSSDQHVFVSRHSGSSVYVQELGKRKHSIRLLADLKKAGDVRDLDNGARVEYVGVEDGQVRVNIYYDKADPTPEDLEIHTGFPTLAEGSTVNPEVSGAWYDPRCNGQGLHVMSHDNRLVVYWYTFNPKDSCRRYYYGVVNGFEEGTVPVFDIYTTEDGTFADPTLYSNIKIGTGRVSFLDGKGLFFFDTTEHGAKSIELEPVALSTDERAGAYYQPSRNGEGFTIDWFRDDTFCAAYWYSYGPRPYLGMARYSKDITTQRWYLCYGPKVADGVYDLNIIEVEGGRLMKPDLATPTDVGKAKLTYNKDGTVKFDYNINTGRINRVEGEGTFDLVRLF